MRQIKNIPNLISISRIVGTVVLLFFKPFSIPFFIIYALCGISDILDGMIARKMDLESKMGQVLDSIADFLMISILLLVLVPYLDLPLWGIYWVVIIAVIRFVSLGVGFLRYRKLAFLHTYANKFTGVVLFCSPFFYVISGLHTTIIFLCIIASISALEELVINVLSKELWRDIKSVFSL